MLVINDPNPDLDQRSNFLLPALSAGVGLYILRHWLFWVGLISFRVVDLDGGHLVGH